jgi:hypothetical protein
MRVVRETDVRLGKHASPWVDDGAGVETHRAGPDGIAPVWLIGRDGAQPMRRDDRRQEHRSTASRTPGRARTRRDRGASIAVEPLEERQLLSLYQGPTRNRALFSGSAFYQVSVTGGGFEKLSQIGSGLHRIIAIDLFGTTTASQLNITFKKGLAAFGSANTSLQIGRINVHSGQLGGINAAAADLVGDVTPLQGTVQTIDFGALGPNAQINVQGSVGTFQAGSVALSPNGLVDIAGDVTGHVSVGALDLNGGKMLIGHNVTGGLSLGGLNITQSGQLLIGNDLEGSSSLGLVDIDNGRFQVGHSATGTVSTGSLTVQNGGQFLVGTDVTSPLQVNGSAKINSNGLLHVGDDLAGLDVKQDLSLDTSGKLVVGTDVTGPITIGAGLNLSNNAQVSIGRDVTGAISITGNVNLDSGGNIAVGRNVNTVTVNGDVRFTPSAGTITIGGNVAGLTINGIYRGRSNTSMSSPELTIGLNLSDFTVLGGASGQGGIENANISVGKQILGLDIVHGIFNSLLTAGVLIDGSPQSASAGGNAGADGTDAIFDSQILSGSEINHITINGNVDSDWVRNPTPTGLPTRIVAGENRNGTFVSGGLIDNFQITGSLIDSVVAASVQPYGGDGTLPPTGYNGNRTPAAPPGPGVPTNYNAPAGVTVGGTFGMPIDYANFGYVSYFNELPTGTAFNTAIDPNIHVNILQGAINPSFASKPLPSSVTTTLQTGSSSTLNQTTTTSGASLTSTTTTTTNFIAIPTKSTVLGGVITTSHDGNPDGNDFAGIFAADASGVFVGQIPPQAP